MSPSRLLSTLQAIVGPEQVLTQDSELEFYSVDAFRPARFPNHRYVPVKAEVVVRPRTTQQVAEVVRLAVTEGVAIVPRGGGTGVMGAAVSLSKGIVLDLALMNAILGISPEDQRARVQAGVVLAELETALNKQGLMLGHDPWSLPIATVGGAISTNGHGYRASKYGSMGDQVLGLQVVLPAGDILDLKGVEKSAGPNMKHLFIGAEGVFGVITEATLKVFPSPELRVLHAFQFDSFEDGYAAVLEMHRLGLKPALLDLSEDVAEPSAEHQTVLYLGCEGFREEVEAQVKRALQICKSHQARDLAEMEARTFWEERHRSGERYRQEVLQNRQLREEPKLASNAFDYLHLSLPASCVLPYLRSCQAIADRYGIHIREYGLWTHPELFSLLLSGPGGQRGRRDMARASDEMLRLAQDVGGAMEYCHGVGIKLAHLMERELGQGHDLLKRIKQSLDPQNTLSLRKLGL